MPLPPSPAIFSNEALQQALRATPEEQAPLGSDPTPGMGTLPQGPEAPPQAKSGGGWKLPAALAVGGQMADLASTRVALQNPALREGNQIVGSNGAVQALVKGGLSVGLALMLKKLADNGNDHAAMILGAALGGYGGITALHNMHELSKAGGKP